MISEEVWEKAKGNLKETYAKSPNYEICANLIKDFECVNNKNKYKTDLEVFIRESKLEDFYRGRAETILVSTFHRAKGREFDNVYLMLDRFNIRSDEDLRLLYVAMTRAKENLTIHHNGDYFKYIKAEKMEVIKDENTYFPPDELHGTAGI